MSVEPHRVRISGPGSDVDAQSNRPLCRSRARHDRKPGGEHVLVSRGPASPAHQASTVLPPNPGPTPQVLRTDRIATEEYALQRALSLFDLRSVRGEFGFVRDPGPRDATLILRDLTIRLPLLQGKDRELANRVLTRPDDPSAEPGLAK